jgi:hypothetical protein
VENLEGNNVGDLVVTRVEGDQVTSVPVGSQAMQRQSDQPDDARIAANLRRAIELTELGLALRQSVIQQNEPQGDAMVTVMRKIRCANEQA